MCPVVSMICGVAARACLAMCLHVNSHHQDCRLFAIFDPCGGSLPWTDHYFGHQICSLLVQLTFVDHSFAWLFCPFRAQPFPPLIGSGSYLVFGQVSFSTEFPSVARWGFVAACRAGSHSQGCHGTYVYLLCQVFLQGLTNLWWDQFPSSAVSHEFNAN